MRRWILALVLLWALASTTLLVVKTIELQKAEKELSKYKTYALENRSKIGELFTKIETLQASNADYKTKYFDLLKKYNKLKLELERKNFTITQLKKKLEEYTKIPLDYYDSYFGEHNNTAKDLMNFTSNLTIPKNLTTFNQKIAYLEWALRNAGFRAHITYGEVEDEESGNETIRTWVIVLLDNGTYCVDVLQDKVVAFNATEEAELEIKINGTEKELEYEPIKIFRDIYSVVDFFGNVDDWAWWKVVGFPPSNHST